VIGGGYIGLELGCMYRKLGSEVTVLEATDGALPGQDRDCVKVIERSLKKSKVKLFTNTFARGYERDGDVLKVRIERSGKEEIVECDQIISTVGRRPHSAGLGLDVIGLSANERGWPLRELSRQAPSLEDLFGNLTHGKGGGK
jgi:dihydrolipoamide dehydrogenase